MLLFTRFQTPLGSVIIAGTLAFWLTLCDDFQTIAYKASTLNLVAKDDHQKLIVGEQTISALMMLVAPILGGVLYPIFTLRQIMFCEIVGEALVFFSLLRLDFKAFGREARTDKQENIFIRYRCWNGIYQRRSATENATYFWSSSESSLDRSRGR